MWTKEQRQAGGKEERMKAETKIHEYEEKKKKEIED